MNELKVQLAAYQKGERPDVLTFTETWTRDNISNDELKLPGYTLITRIDRKDMSNGRGGGILTYAADWLRVT